MPWVMGGRDFGSGKHLCPMLGAQVGKGPAKAQWKTPGSGGIAVSTWGGGVGAVGLVQLPPGDGGPELVSSEEGTLSTQDSGDH